MNDAPRSSEGPPIGPAEQAMRRRAAGRAIARFFVFLGVGIWGASVVWGLIDSPASGNRNAFVLGMAGAGLATLAFYTLVLQSIWTVGLKRWAALVISFVSLASVFGGWVGFGLLLGWSTGMLAD